MEGPLGRGSGLARQGREDGRAALPPPARPGAAPAVPGAPAALHSAAAGGGAPQARRCGRPEHAPRFPPERPARAKLTGLWQESLARV